MIGRCILFNELKKNAGLALNVRIFAKCYRFRKMRKQILSISQLLRNTFFGRKYWLNFVCEKKILVLSSLLGKAFLAKRDPRSVVLCLFSFIAGNVRSPSTVERGNRLP